MLCDFDHNAMVKQQEVKVRSRRRPHLPRLAAAFVRSRRIKSEWCCTIPMFCSSQRGWGLRVSDPRLCAEVVHRGRRIPAQEGEVQQRFITKLTYIQHNCRSAYPCCAMNHSALAQAPSLFLREATTRRGSKRGRVSDG